MYTWGEMSININCGEVHGSRAVVKLWRRIPSGVGAQQKCSWPSSPFFLRKTRASLANRITF